jgi:hypothetical protein
MVLGMWCLGGVGLISRNVNRKMTPCDNPILTPL